MEIVPRAAHVAGSLHIRTRRTSTAAKRHASLTGPSRHEPQTDLPPPPCGQPPVHAAMAERRTALVEGAGFLGEDGGVGRVRCLGARSGPAPNECRRAVRTLQYVTGRAIYPWLPEISGSQGCSGGEPAPPSSRYKWRSGEARPAMSALRTKSSARVLEQIRPVVTSRVSPPGRWPGRHHPRNGHPRRRSRPTRSRTRRSGESPVVPPLRFFWWRSMAPSGSPSAGRLCRRSRAMTARSGGAGPRGGPATRMLWTGAWVARPPPEPWAGLAF